MLYSSLNKFREATTNSIKTILSSRRYNNRQLLEEDTIKERFLPHRLLREGTSNNNLTTSNMTNKARTTINNTIRIMINKGRTMVSKINHTTSSNRVDRTTHPHINNSKDMEYEGHPLHQMLEMIIDSRGTMTTIETNVVATVVTWVVVETTPTTATWEAGEVEEYRHITINKDTTTDEVRVESIQEKEEAMLHLLRRE
jgi:hypothetical protein